MSILRKVLIFLCMLLSISSLPIFAQPSGYAYNVEFQGIDDETEGLLKSASQLIALIDFHPPTAAALKRRADEDIPNLLKALQSQAFYNAKITLSIDYAADPAIVKLTVATGPVYPFSSFHIVPSGEIKACPYPLESISAEGLGISIGSPALPSCIIDAEDTLKNLLEKEGYPLAKIEKRELVADQTAKTIAVIFHVDTGPLSYFGWTKVEGAEDVLPAFFSKKIAWHEGERYHPDCVKHTINALESSGLFSSINITHGDAVQEDGSLPMFIDIKEAKKRSIGFGVGYATDLGPGVNFEWEHRNFRGMGEKLSVVANIWQIKQEGYIRYLLPDFLFPRQDLIWQAEVESEQTKGFDETSASFSSIIERQLTDRIRISYGGMFTLLRNTRSNNNREFNLLKAPMQFMWNGTNNLLDPTFGTTLHLKITPTYQTINPRFAYTTHTLTATAYQPLDCKYRFVLAGKVSLGSIWGANKHSIPPSERLYAGSDTTLRGYRYLTVSPLGRHHKPIGGRSLMVYSLETRWRMTETFGLVAFYDIGNVYAQSLPQFGNKQLQSTGLGIRYHTPVGPLRLDIAVPLNRRHHLDHAFEIYFSIGQAF